MSRKQGRRTSTETVPTPDALLQAGLKHHRAGRLDQAEAAYRSVLKRYPQHPDAIHLIGMVEYARGHLDRALELVDRAIALAPNQAAMRCNRGALLRELGRGEEAIEAFRLALAIEPDRQDALGNLGVALSDAGRHAEAAETYTRVLAVNPRDTKTQTNLGNALARSNRLGEALTAYRAALAIDPFVMTAQVGAARALAGLGQAEAAEAYLRSAIAVLRASIAKPGIPVPERAEGLNLLGSMLQVLMALDEAEAAHREAVAVNPTGPHRLNLALLELLRGRFESGWAGYEARWETPDFEKYIRPMTYPAWDGGPPAGKTLLVTAEQGVGDQVMLAGFVPELVAAGARVVVEADERLTTLFARSLAVEVVPSTNPPHPIIAAARPDARVPMGTLCRHLRPSADSFQPKGRYLEPDAALVGKLRARYAALGPGMKIGISWRSGNPANGWLRSAPLSRWGAVLALPDLHFVNLQYGATADELDEARRLFGIDIFADPEVDGLGDLDAFAAQVDALDLVISVDNSTVHIAGALGKPAWALLPYSPDWRWGTSGEDTPWYTSVRLFRQKRFGDWPGVFTEVAAELGRGRVSPAPQRAIPQADVMPRVLLVNDTSAWYHWGCTGTSTAIRVVVEALGHPVELMSIRQVYGLKEPPSTLGDFDSSGFFQRFAAANPGVIRQLERADVVLINGEGTLHGLVPHVRGLLYLAWVAKRALGKNVQIINHSCYPQDGAAITDVVSNGLYKKVYQSLDFVAIREHVSRGLMGRLGIEAALAFDCLPLYIADAFEKAVPRSASRLLVAGSALAAQAPMAAIAAFLRDMSSKGFQIEVLTGARAFPALDDQQFIDALRQAMPEGWLHVDADSMDEWLSAIAGARLLVSGRFHHSIAAATLGTPFVTMSSNTPKVGALLEMLEHAPVVPIDAPDLAERLAAAAEAELALPLEPPGISARGQALAQMALRNFDGLVALQPRLEQPARSAG